MHKIIIMFSLVFMPVKLAALTFEINPSSDIVGKKLETKVNPGQSLGNIGRLYGIGTYEMIEANPNLDPWVPEVGESVVIPSSFILPKIREGLVINLAEMRLYYFHNDKNLVTTMPIGIGRKGWFTPLGKTAIIKKEKNPSWRPPQSIRESYDKKGKFLPKIIPPGPHNPLGQFALRLNITNILVHGSNRKGGIGVRSSHGCIRLFPEDISFLYQLVEVGTPVHIIHRPYKIGKDEDTIYIEAHQPLSEDYYDETELGSKTLVEALESSGNSQSDVDITAIGSIAKKYLGYPIAIN